MGRRKNDTETVPTYRRQIDIFNPESAEQRRVHVIGCGTIGSWTVLALHKMGVKDVLLWDFDTVEDVNISGQAFNADDIGQNKASVLGERYGYAYICERYFEVMPESGAIYVLAVDSLESRREILASLPETAHVIDGRMGGEGYEVHYGTPKTITVPQAASEDLCTAKGIIYVSLGIAAEIAAAVKKLLQSRPIEYRTVYRDYRAGDTLTIKAKTR